jgi:hypothetical protein
MKIYAQRTVLASVVAVSALPGVSARVAGAQCSLDSYKSQPGLQASSSTGGIALTWTGSEGVEFRARIRIVDGTPTIVVLDVKPARGTWRPLAVNLSPEFRIASGYRRLDNEAYPALQKSVGKVTQQVLDHYKWDAFWDAPLHVPGDEPGHHGATPPPNGIPGTNQLGLPRKVEEVRHAVAVFHATACTAKTDGARMEISFPGVEAGIFSGRLQYTIYRGINLIRVELIAKTEFDSVAYKYDGGLTGFPVEHAHLRWHDIAGTPQIYGFEGPAAPEIASVRSANRILAMETPAGSIATFPPPHNFFWVREISTNLGYNWYRKDSDRSFSMGIRQPEDEEAPAFSGRGSEDRRQNFALYNARPGTWQRMPVYFFIAPGTGQAALDGVLAFTRGDHYQPLPGYWVMARHFHTSPITRMLEGDGLASPLPDFEVARATGVNIFGPVGAGEPPHADTPATDALAAALASADPTVRDSARLELQALYYRMARLQSSERFLIMPNEELFRGPIGGHDDVLLSHPVYWVMDRRPGQPLVEDSPRYGKVYHIGSPDDLMEMSHRENMVILMPHPDTKASAGYPRAFKDASYFRDPSYLGAGFRWGMGIDRSEQRLSDYRCMPIFDDMNNWVADLPVPPKYMDAIVEGFEQGPGDDFYANSPVTYIRPMGRPGIDNWAPIIDAMKAGNFFVTSGEVLIPQYEVRGVGSRRLISASVQWTFPLEFAEIVWGDGLHTGRRIIPLTELPAFGKQHFEFPIDTTGKKWVRFAVWDSAGNGAFVQPIKLTGN